MVIDQYRKYARVRPFGVRTETKYLYAALQHLEAESDEKLEFTTATDEEAERLPPRMAWKYQADRDFIYNIPLGLCIMRRNFNGLRYGTLCFYDYIDDSVGAIVSDVAEDRDDFLEVEEAYQRGDFQWKWIPDTISLYGQNLTNMYGADPLLNAVTLMTVPCAAMGNKAKIRLIKTRSNLVSANLYSLVIAGSGAGKTGAIGAAVSPIRIEEEKFRKIYDEDYAIWLKEQNEWKQKDRDFKKTSLGGSAPGVQPQKPTRTEFITKKLTNERMPTFIEETKGRGLYASDEGSYFFNEAGSSAQRGGGVDFRTNILTASTGDQVLKGHFVDRAKEYYVKDASLSILLGIQHDKMNKELAKEEKSSDGLIARFQLMAFCKNSTGDNFAVHEDREARDRYGAAITRLLTMDFKPYYFFSKEAQKLYIEWQTENHKTMNMANDNHDNMLGELLAKRNTLIASLCLSFHVLTWFENKSTPPPEEIGIDILKAAISISDWFLKHREGRGNDMLDREEKKEEDISVALNSFFSNADRVAKYMSKKTFSAIVKNIRPRPTVPQFKDAAVSFGYVIGTDSRFHKKAKPG